MLVLVLFFLGVGEVFGFKVCREFWVELMSRFECFSMVFLVFQLKFSGF